MLADSKWRYAARRARYVARSISPFWVIKEKLIPVAAVWQHGTTQDDGWIWVGMMAVYSRNPATEQMTQSYQARLLIHNRAWSRSRAKGPGGLPYVNPSS